MSRGPDFSTRPAARQQTGTVALLAAAVVAFALAASATLSAWASLRENRHAVAELRAELAQARARAQILESRGDLGESLTTQILASAEAPPMRVLADLGGILPGNVRLESLTLTYGARLDVDMQVAAKSATAYDLFLGRLEDSPRFRDVLTGPEGREGEVKASVRASYRVGAGR